MPIGRRPTAISSPAKTGLGGGSALALSDRLLTGAIRNTKLVTNNLLGGSLVTFTADALTVKNGNTSTSNYAWVVLSTNGIKIGDLENRKLYWEVTGIQTGGGTTNVGATVIPPTLVSNLSNSTSYFSMYFNGAYGSAKGGVNYSGVANPANPGLTGTISFILNAATGDLILYVNGVVQNNGLPYTTFNKGEIVYPYIGLLPYNDNLTINYGASAFKYTLPLDTVPFDSTVPAILVAKANQFDKIIKSVVDYDIRPKIEEVFSTNLIIYGNTRATVKNDLNLLYRSGLVLENVIDGGYNWTLSSSLRGSNRSLANTTGSEIIGSGISFNQDGFSTVSYSSTQYSSRGIAYTFIANPYFFNTITWFGTGVNNRPLQHGLKIPTGMIVGKPISDPNTGYDWYVWHRSITHMAYFNSSAAGSTTRFILDGTDLTNFIVQGNANVNGQTHEAFIFGHDTSPKGLIQCGIFSSEGPNASGTINHGWAEGVQFIIHKRVIGSGSIAGGNWFVYDTVRNVGFTGPDLYSILSGASTETASTGDGYNNISDSNGVLTIGNTGFGASDYIYVIIRAKTPTPITNAPVIASFSQSSTAGPTYTATIANMAAGTNTDAQTVAATNSQANQFIQAALSASTFVKSVTIGSPNSSITAVSSINGAQIQFSNDGGTTFTPIYTIAGFVASTNNNLVKYVIPINQNCTHIRVFRAASGPSVALSQFYVT